MIVAKRVLGLLPKVDILTLHVPTPVLPMLGPICYLLAKVYRKPFVLRKFGGTDYRDLGFIPHRLAVWAVNHSDAYLAEAKALVSVAKSHGANRTFWYPNSRPARANLLARIPMRESCRRFVYVGQVRRVKGILEIAQAVGEMELKYPVDIYGPFEKGLNEEVLREYRNIRYCGVLDPSRVIEVLGAYDALLLPTYHAGEGYPGVILEAYCAGIPVICSRWRFLPEIVNESCGLFVEPNDVLSLREAMQRLQHDDKLFQTLQNGARNQTITFDSVHWNNEFVIICRQVLSGGNS